MNTHRLIQRLSFTALGAALLVPLAGCSSDDGDAPGTGNRPEGAILVAERFSTPDGRVMYMGAFAEMPSSDVDITQLTELGPSGDVFSCDGDAFFFDSDALVLRKYVVEDDLSLSQAEEIQLAQAGITGWTGAHVCVSGTQAFMFEGSGGRVVEYNPETMTIIEAFDIPAPDTEAGMGVQFFEPYASGNLVYFPLDIVNWDTVEAGRAALAAFDTTDKSVTYTYDDRCQGGLSGHVASDGTFYRYQGYGAFFETYSTGATPPPDCVLRINPGERSFDPNYMSELGPTNNMWSVGDHGAVVMKVDPNATFPSEENLWDWYALPVVPTLVDLETGEESAYSGLSNEPPMNARKLIVDGQSYFQLNSFNEDGDVTQTRLMRLTSSGAEEVFVLKGGDFLTLERLW